MATYQDGNRRQATGNTVSAMRRSAEARRCPACDRRSALSSYVEDLGDGQQSVTRCRWADCGYARWIDKGTGRLAESWPPRAHADPQTGGD